MSFREALEADLRLEILKVLSVAPGFTLNGASLRSALDQVGHYRSAAMVAAALSHLEQVGAVTLGLLPPLTVATLTQAGQDAVENRAALPGVRQPNPGE